MDHFTYLANELSKYQHSKSKNYAFFYQLTKFKRFLALTIMAFSFQYLCIYHLKAAYPIYPLYPAIGIAFTVIAILGENAILGLLLGELCAYYLKGYSSYFIFLYCTADLLCAYVGAYLSRHIFVSDIPRQITKKQWRQFLGVNALVACFSAGLRVLAIPLNKNIVYIFINNWFADLNSMVLFYVFLSTWLSLYMSREKISTCEINKYFTTFHILLTLSILFFMKNIWVIYFLLLNVGFVFYLNYRYGIGLGTLALYIFSMLYVTYFIVHQIHYLTWLGISGYIIIPAFLAVIIVSTPFSRRRESIHSS